MSVIRKMVLFERLCESINKGKPKQEKQTEKGKDKDTTSTKEGKETKEIDANKRVKAQNKQAKRRK